jgi:hypothetical protein
MEQGEFILEKSRAKTGEAIKQVLIIQAVSILKKYEVYIMIPMIPTQSRLQNVIYIN